MGIKTNEMKIERLVIGVLLLVLAWLFLNKTPKLGDTKIKYLNKYEIIVDSIEYESEATKQKIKEYKSKSLYLSKDLKVLKDSLEIAKNQKDTVKIIVVQERVINNQDSIIEQKDITIKYQDTLIEQCSEINLNLNKNNDLLKDSIIDLNIKIGKQKKRSKFVIAAIAVLGGTGILFK